MSEINIDDIVEQIELMEEQGIRPAYVIVGENQLLSMIGNLRDAFVNKACVGIDGGATIFGYNVVIDVDNPDRGPRVAPESSARTVRWLRKKA